MSDRDRFHKDEPKRSHPRRNMSEALRNDDPWSVRPQANGSRPFRHADFTRQESPGEGVDDAYRVVDDQMREGQWRARWRNPPGPDWRGYGSPYGGGIGGRPADGLLEQMTRVYLDMMGLVGTMINGVVRPSYPSYPPAYPPARFDNRREPDFQHRDNGRDRPEFDRRERSAAVRVEVTSNQSSQVILDLKPVRTGVSLIVSPLRTMNNGRAEITEVEFDTSKDRCVLRVHIPDNQPPGLYSGVVADSRTSEPYGTITIRVGRNGPRVHPQRAATKAENRQS